MDSALFVILLVKGLVIGVVVAAPVGPIGLLCIRRTLEHRVGVGLATGAGAALADAIFGCIAAFGISAVQAVLEEWALLLQAVGSIALLAIAWVGLRSAPKVDVDKIAAPISQRSLVQGFATGLGLTLTNPMTIVGFVFTFASFGAGRQIHGMPDAAGVLVLGVFLGSMLWWSALCGAVMAVRNRMSDKLYARINTVAALAIGAIGAVGAIDLVWRLLT